MIGWNGSVLRSFIEEAKVLGVDLRVKYPRLDPLNEDYVEFVKGADVVMIHHFSSEQLYSDILSRLEGVLRTKEHVIALDPVLSKYSTEPKEVLRKVSDYYTYGGRQNIRNLILFLVSLVKGGVSYAEPKPLPFSGIYDPDTKEHLGSLELFLKRYDTGRRVGILFYRTSWADGDTEVVDSLAEELKRRGLTPIPVFTQGFGDKSRGIEGNDEVLRRYFYLGGKPAVHAVISLLSFSLTKGNLDLLRELNVPIFQGLIYYYRTLDEWRESDGLDPVSTIMSVTLPEMEGVIEPVLVGVIQKVKSEKGEVYRVLKPVKEQVEYLADRVGKWIELRTKPNRAKRVAIVLHSGSAFKDVEANIGTATGLDTLETVVQVMRLLKKRGYEVSWIPENGQELVREILRRKALPESKWTTLEEISEKGGAVGRVSLKEYLQWFNGMPSDSRESVRKRWGELREGKRDYMFDGNSFLIPGLISGNIFIGVQPKRITWAEDENSIRLIHDSTTPVPHYWIAFYRWIEEGFKADVVIHVGTHGTLEFTPGKGVGLSSSCFPQISIGRTPHVYIYSINVPGEGIVAKRRSYAVLIGHLTPPTVYDELPEQLKKLEDLLEEYEEAEHSGNERAEKVVLSNIRKMAEEVGLSVDFSDPGKATHEIEHRLNIFKDSVISKGLHVLGNLPPEEDLAEYVVTSTRFDPNSLSQKLGRAKAKEIVLSGIRGETKLPWLEGGVLASLLESLEKERENLLRALNGEFIEAGGSGSLARGRYDVLPTGRNFFAVDPHKVPTMSAWQIGSALAERLIERRARERKRYPRALGFVLWSTDVYRSDGELVSQILRTIGARPVWQEGTRRVTGVELIPLQELGRPRIDVVVEISGIVRDNLLNVVELIDEAIQKAASADEPESLNFIRANSQALGHSTRIFSSRPGAYGSGVSHAVESSQWKDEGELADVFINWMGYAYGKGKFGIEAKGELMKVSKLVEGLVHKREIDEIDILDDSCNYSYVGGFYAAVRKGGGEPEVVFEDTFNPNSPRIRSMKEEIERVSVMKLLNEKWIEAQKAQGYRGGTEILKKVEHLYGWAATTRLVEDRILDNVARKFLLDSEMREWFKRNNPWAMEGIARRLMEASKRGIWRADEEVLRRIEDLYLEVEGEIEE